MQAKYTEKLSKYIPSQYLPDIIYVYGSLKNSIKLQNCYGLALVSCLVHFVYSLVSYNPLFVKQFVIFYRKSKESGKYLAFMLGVRKPL